MFSPLSFAVIASLALLGSCQFPSAPSGLTYVNSKVDSVVKLSYKAVCLYVPTRFFRAHHSLTAKPLRDHARSQILRRLCPSTEESVNRCW